MTTNENPEQELHTGEPTAVGPQEEVSTEPSDKPIAGSLPVQVHQGQETLICAVCAGPIERNVAYLEAAYGPVHYNDCSHQSRPV